MPDPGVTSCDSGMADPAVTSRDSEVVRTLPQQCCWAVHCFMRLFLFLLNNLYCIPSHVVWMWLLRPLRAAAPRLYWRVEGVLFRWLLNMVGMLSYTAGYDVIEMGDRIDHLETENCLFIVNHQSTADVPILMNMMTAHGRAADHAMWIMDVMFKWTNFGVVSQLHHDFFIECGKARRDKSVELLKAALEKDYVGLNRKWIMLFPEGGFLKNRKEVSQRFAEKQGLPRLERVTLPRVGAALAVLNLKQNGDRLRPNGCDGSVQLTPATDGLVQPPSAKDCVRRRRVRWVVDLTVAYPDQRRPLDLTSVMAGSRPPCSVYFYYRLFPADQVPEDDAQLTTWLYQLFYDKEWQLNQYYTTGSLPPHPPEKHACSGDGPLPAPRRLVHDPTAWLLRHLFFIGSTALQWRLLAAAAAALYRAAAALVW